SLAADREDLNLSDLGIGQGIERPVAAFPIHDQERNVLMQQPEQKDLRGVGLAPASDRENADVFDEIFAAKVQGKERFPAIKDRSERKLSRRGSLRRRRQQNLPVINGARKITAANEWD